MLATVSKVSVMHAHHHSQYKVPRLCQGVSFGPDSWGELLVLEVEIRRWDGIHESSFSGKGD